MARPRNILRELEALRLRAEGLSQVETSEELGVCVRQIQRYERRFRTAPPSLPEASEALWRAYAQEVQARRRLSYLQSLARISVAQAEEVAHSIRPKALR